MTQETLREEFYKRRARDEFTLSNGKLSTDKVADWWLNRIAQRDKELVEKLEGVKKDTSKYEHIDKRTGEIEYTGKLQCRSCGSYKDIAEDNFNDGIITAQALIQGNSTEI